jgi:hypothetical protein
MRQGAIDKRPIAKSVFHLLAALQIAFLNFHRRKIDSPVFRESGFHRENLCRTHQAKSEREGVSVCGTACEILWAK